MVSIINILNVIANESTFCIFSETDMEIANALVSLYILLTYLVKLLKNYGIGRYTKKNEIISSK